MNYRASQRQIVVVTPVRNEAWILKIFLDAVSQFADHIIVLDQHSDDGSLEIAAQYPKVLVIPNPSIEFNELERQNLLLTAARRFGLGNVIIALDADEIPTSDIFEEGFLDGLRRYPEGTVFKFDWMNLLPDLVHYYHGNVPPVGFVDDGKDNVSTDRIHRTRVPVTQESQVVELSRPKILHFQYLDQARVARKHAWYQALERETYPTKSVLSIYRTYNHIVSRREASKISIPMDMIAGWRDRGVLFEDIQIGSVDGYHWDSEIIRMLKRNSDGFFKDIDIPQALRQNKDRNRSWLLWYATRTQRATGRGLFDPLRLTIRLVDSLLIHLFGK